MRITIRTLIQRILRGIKNVLLIFSCCVGVAILLLLVRCNKDEYSHFDRMMLAGWNTSDTIVDLSRLTPFQWDTMYYYENGCSEEVMASFGVIADASMQDVMDSFGIMQDVIIFKDKKGRTVYWDKWIYSWENSHYGNGGFIIIPDFNYLRVSSDDALFKVRKKTDCTILLEHLPRGEERQD